MISLSLKLRHSPVPLRETQAWFIAGSDMAAWLREISHWHVDQVALQIWPIPRSNSDRAPGGVLVTVSKAKLPAEVSSICIPFGKVAGQLYLPVEASLDPEITEAELQSELAPGNHYVWHPGLGLISFEPDDAIQLAELISVSSPRVRRWDLAQPGITLAPRLVSLKPDVDPSPEKIFQQGQDDIGTEKDQLSSLPPSELEPNPGMISGASRQGMRMFASMIRWLAQHAPQTSSEPTWIDKLENWASGKLANFYAGLDAERNKELARLMEMLDSDPDRGLRFALPLHGDAHRGIAPPGGRLVERPTNFNLNQVGGGGGAADFWDLSGDYRHRLTLRYRELANREMNLGRHRRAAYIFAELLGDFHAAAGALAAGHHYREAAAIYQKRLNRPQDAVRCLEAGGHWNEAIELYLDLKEFEKAGDLYQKLDQTEAAEAQYRQAVDKSRSKGDSLDAARLLERKLGSVDEALVELTAAWPNSSQATPCLRESFQLLGRLGRHNETERRIAMFGEDPLPAKHRIALVEIVADVAIQYPDQRVQTQAADCTRVLVARQLSEVSKTDARVLLTAMSRIVPEDRLLTRDCQRFLQQLEVKKPPVRPTKPPRQGKPVRKVSTLHLPRAVHWDSAVSSGNMIVAAGYHKHQLVVSRGSWIGFEPQAKMWSRIKAENGAPILLAVASERKEFVLVHPLLGPIMPEELEFHATGECPFVTKVGALRGMSPQVLAAAGTSHGIIWLLEVRNQELTMIAVGANGEQVFSETLTLPEVPIEFAEIQSVLPFPFHARQDTRYVGWYNRLLVYEKARPLQTFEFVQPIASIVGSAPFTLTRIALSFPRGGTLLWDDFESKHAEPFGQDLEFPIVCINRQGYLIAASDNIAEVYTTYGKQLQLESRLTLSGSKAIAVLASPQANQFAVVFESGEISTYEIG